MRALVWHGKEDIRCDTVSDPEIQDSRDAIVKVTSCAICGSDLHLFHNFVPAMLPGDIMGHEMMGEVVEVGSGVRRVKAGDKVAGCFFQRWPGGDAAPDVHSTALGGGIDGMLAEYVVLEEEGVVKIPAHLSLEEGATLPCAAEMLS